MATFKSNEITQVEATPMTPGDPSFIDGRIRVAKFSWTGDAAQNDFVELCYLPAGARILRGIVDHTAFGASVTLDIGTVASEALYAAALNVAAAGNLFFANTPALSGAGDVKLTARTLVQAKFEAANPASGTLKGFLEYVVD